MDYNSPRPGEIVDSGAKNAKVIPRARYRWRFGTSSPETTAIDCCIPDPNPLKTLYKGSS
jgi:hypothetical protein